MPTTPHVFSDEDDLTINHPPIPHHRRRRCPHTRHVHWDEQQLLTKVEKGVMLSSCRKNRSIAALDSLMVQITNVQENSSSNRNSSSSSNNNNNNTNSCTTTVTTDAEAAALMLAYRQSTRRNGDGASSNTNATAEANGYIC